MRIVKGSFVCIAKAFRILSHVQKVEKAAAAMYAIDLGWMVERYPDKATGIALDDGNGIILNGILYKPALLHGPYAIHRIRTCIYHRQYCRCDVTGRSGSAVHSLRLSRFFLSSSEMRIRVFSSLRRTEKPVVHC